MLHRNKLTILPILLISTTLQITGCGSESAFNEPSTSPCDSFDCAGLVANLSNNVILPTYTQFLSNAQTTQSAIDNYCGDLSADNKATAQNAFLESMATWQQAEVMQIGPLTDNSNTLRDTIYSWPATNTCGVDQDVVYADEGQTPDSETYDITSRSLSRQGLDALDYLLFADTLTHTCTSNITATENWNALSETERETQRCQYAALVAGNIVATAQTLVNQWDGTSGSYLADITSAGEAGSSFATIEEAVNTLSDAMFYVEKQVKDVKLAVPLGLKENSCNTDSVCPEDVELPHSNTSIINVRNNLLALQAMYLGQAIGTSTNGLGFDDYLSAAGDDNVSAMMEADLATAILAVSDENFTTPLATMLTNNIEIVESAHAGIKAVTDRLKDDFIMVLGLTIPSGAQGDSD